MDNSCKKDKLLPDGLIHVKKCVGETCEESSPKSFKPLKLPKSQLSLYNEGKFLGISNVKPENQINIPFSALDSVIPSALEIWTFHDDLAQQQENNDNEQRKEGEDSENVLSSSMSNIQGETNKMECSLQKKSSWEKVCGLTEAKNTLKNVFIYRILYPHFFPDTIQWNKVLLYGPPGTGKSLLARAVAEEIDAILYKVSSADLLSHWQGETEKHIRALFEEARSCNCPVVLFFDEIDGLCRSRTSSESDLVRRIKTELLIQFESDELDGEHNKQTYLVGATNCPWDIDPAFLRRFHKKIYVPLPDKEARIDILKQGFGDMETELTENEWDNAGKLTEGYSGSDLANVVMSSCCERLVSMMNCHFWKSNGEFWVPAVPNSMFSVRIDFQNLPSHQIQFRSINFSDVRSGIAKTAKTISQEELLKFAEYAAKYS